MVGALLQWEDMWEDCHCRWKKVLSNGYWALGAVHCLLSSGYCLERYSGSTVQQWEGALPLLQWEVKWEHSVTVGSLVGWLLQWEDKWEGALPLPVEELCWQIQDIGY